MDLARYLEILNRRKWVVIITALAAVLVAGVGARLQTPTYAAAATVRVAQAAQGAVEYTDYIYAERLMNTYAAMLESWPVLHEVAQRLQIDQQPAALDKQIAVEVLPNTELLRVSVKDQDPVLARDLANALAAVLVEQGQSFYFGGEKSAREILQEQMATTRRTIEDDRAVVQAILDGEAPWDRQRVDDLIAKIKLEEEMYADYTKKYEEARLAEASRANSVTIVEPAIKPERPAQPQLPVLLLAGAVIGLIGGIGLAFLLESLDPTLHAAADLERVTAAPVLAAVPRVPWPKTAQGLPAFAGAADSALGEAFRFLRTNLLLSAPGAALRTVLVTSAEPGVGKSVVLINLAAALAQAGARVIAVDTDLRRPFLHQALRCANDRGLSSLLQSQAAAAPLLRETPMANVKVLTSGPPLADPAAALSLSRTREVMQELTEAADMVLFDSPPVLAVADAVLLAPLVDGVVIVVGCDRTPRSQALRALRQIETVGGKPLGFVFNQIKTQDEYYPRYYRSLGGAAAPGARTQMRLPLWQRVVRGLAIAVMALVACFILVAGAQQRIGLSQPRSAPAVDTAQAGSLPQGAAPSTTATALVAAAAAGASNAEGLPVGSGAATGTDATSGGAQAVTTLTPSSPDASAASPSATPDLLPHEGMIPYRSTYLYGDPHDLDSKIFLIPANWQVMILENNVPGASIGGTGRWSRVRVALRGDFYEGYIISRYIEETEP
jgi:non-specific protein-tyrosine kinase